MNTLNQQDPFCQSCSMPLTKKEDFGTNKDGSQNAKYCHYCYNAGQFSQPNATLEQMIEKSTEAMRQMKMPEALIEQTKKIIPTLERWKK